MDALQYNVIRSEPLLPSPLPFHCIPSEDGDGGEVLLTCWMDLQMKCIAIRSEPSFATSLPLHSIPDDDDDEGGEVLLTLTKPASQPTGCSNPPWGPLGAPCPWTPAREDPWDPRRSWERRPVGAAGGPPRPPPPVPRAPLAARPRVPPGGTRRASVTGLTCQGGLGIDGLYGLW